MMKSYYLEIESYYDEATQLLITLLENAGAVITNHTCRAIEVLYEGDFAEVISEIEETNIAGCHLIDYQEVE